MFTYIKTLILFRQAVKQTSPYNFTNKYILYLSPLGFWKKIQSSYFPPNFFLKLHQWKLIWEEWVFDLESCMWWIWSDQ